MRRHSDNDEPGGEAPGLAELLAAPREEKRRAADDLLGDPADSESTNEGTGSLAVLGTGNAPPNPARLLTGDALDLFFSELARSDYTYVLIEGPPLLGVADCRFWAQRVDGTLVVSKPDLLEPNDVIEMRRVLDSVDANALGHAVVNGRVGTP
jgi:succinoglycan biosynthesis transport protein ExoP